MQNLPEFGVNICLIILLRASVKNFFYICLSGHKASSFESSLTCWIVLSNPSTASLTTATFLIALLALVLFSGPMHDS